MRYTEKENNGSRNIIVEFGSDGFNDLLYEHVKNILESVIYLQDKNAKYLSIKEDLECVNDIYSGEDIEYNQTQLNLQ